MFRRVILVSVLNIIGNLIDANLALISILDVAGDPALLSVIAAHLLFNMKEAGEKGHNQGTSCGSKLSASRMEFAAPPEAATTQLQTDTSEIGGVTETGDLLEEA